MKSHYDAKDIAAAQHLEKLKEQRQDHMVLRLDADHRDLGMGSCAPSTLNESSLKTDSFRFTLQLY